MIELTKKEKDMLERLKSMNDMVNLKVTPAEIESIIIALKFFDDKLLIDKILIS